MFSIVKNLSAIFSSKNNPLKIYSTALVFIAMIVSTRFFLVVYLAKHSYWHAALFPCSISTALELAKSNSCQLLIKELRTSDIKFRY